VNRWRPSTAFLLKTLDNVSSKGRGTRIAASSHSGISLKGTKVSNLYIYFKYIFLTIPGIFGSPLVYICMCIKSAYVGATNKHLFITGLQYVYSLIYPLYLHSISSEVN